MMIFRNKSGFSLLEIVIAMGLATGLLLFYMKMNSDQVKTQRTAKINAEMETFFSDFKGTLMRPGFCEKSFNGNSFSSSGPIVITEIKSPRGDVRYAVGGTYANHSIKLAALNLHTFKPDSTDGREGVATLEITLEKIGKVFGAPIVKRNMEIAVSLGETLRIEGCGTLASPNVNINIVTPKNSTPDEQNTKTPETVDTTSTTNPAVIPESAPAKDAIDMNQKQLLEEMKKHPQYQELEKAMKELNEQNKLLENLDN